MITLFGINNCDTVKKTKKWLEEQGAEYNFHDYKKLGCSEELAKQFLEQFELKEVINTRGTTWRKLSDEDKSTLNPKSAVVLMQTQPSIIKRPILDIDGQWVIGFDTELLSTLIE
ncbi:MAG: ArsC family reductase [Pseudomonadales bacterium]|nr:ArsC family reductase [Pseudomonadales bacterium]